MSVRHAVAAAFFLATSFASGANAATEKDIDLPNRRDLIRAPYMPSEKCTHWVNISSSTETLFAVPPAQWNIPLIASFGKENINKLSVSAQRYLPHELKREAQSLFRNVERAQRLNREVNWGTLSQITHKALHPVIEKLRTGEVTLEEGKTLASAVSAAHVVSIVKALSSIPAAPAQCLTQYAGPAPAR